MVFYKFGGPSQGLGRSGRSINQGQSEIHDTGGRERLQGSGQGWRGGASALQPQEGKTSAARAMPACAPSAEPAQELSSTRCS